MKSASFIFLFASILLCSSCSKSSQITGLYNGEVSIDGIHKPASCEVTTIDDSHVKLLTTVLSSSGTITYTVSVTKNEGSEVYHLDGPYNGFIGAVSGNVLTWSQDDGHNSSFQGSK